MLLWQPPTAPYPLGEYVGRAGERRGEEREKREREREREREGREREREREREGGRERE